MEILLNNKCEGILPFSRLRDGEINIGVYNCEGYMPLRELSNVSGLIALRILELLINTVEQLKDYLFYPDEYIISTDTIFINRDYTNLKFMYIPYKLRLSERRYYKNMVFYLEKVTTEIGREYLEKALVYMDSNPKYVHLIAYIRNLKSELEFFETK